MKSAEVIQVALGITGLIVIPLLVFVVRTLIHGARMEAKLDTAIQDLAELVKNKDATHAAMLDQMKYDRDATDKRLHYLEDAHNKRLRFLEEYVWRQGSNRNRQKNDPAA